MAYIIWKESFNIGVQEMDDQHRLLVNYINDLYESIQAGNSEDNVEIILNKLTEYIQLHFAAEEAILKSVNYPLLDSQIKQHEYYVSELNFLKSGFLDEAQTAQNMLLFLKDWFLHHITTEDLKYVEFVKKTQSMPA